MKQRFLIQFFICVLLLSGWQATGARVALAEPGVEVLAVKIAHDWLSLVDKKEYEASWEQSGAHLKGAVSKKKWVRTLRRMRKQFGKAIDRTVRGTQYILDDGEKSEGSARKGEYVLVQFVTNFSKRQGLIETITPMKDSEGRWRISGYYVIDPKTATPGNR